MVQALHNAGIRVVMDVVYNHTYTTGGGPFDAVVPQYYYRTTLTGEYANGSACGNEVASERPMVRKFIADSCLYWAREYGVDGFRFDLMGLIDVPTMEHITKTLRAHDPTMLIYGEPWQAGGSVLDTMLQTTIGKQKGKGFAVFNDRIREAIKGGSDDGTRGFATGAAGNEKRIVNGVMGSISDFTERASESINYVTAHDNLNLWDKIAISYKPAQSLANAPYSLLDPQKPLLDNDAVKSVLLANGIIFTSQGIPFFQAGDEFLRSKAGDSNSYASPDSVNQIRWANAATYRAVTDYYAGLIRLRKEHPAFRMDSRADIERHLAVVTAKDSVVAFMLKDNAGSDSWGKIFVAYNANNTLVTLDLPDSGAWQQVVNGQGAGTTTLDTVSDTVTLPGLSMAVLYQ
jgi:pullulanase